MRDKDPKLDITIDMLAGDISQFLPIVPIVHN